LGPTNEFTDSQDSKVWVLQSDLHTTSSHAEPSGYEAGDLLAAAVAAELQQRASSRITIKYPPWEIVRRPKRSGNSRASIQSRDFSALRGDPSNELPGASRVGPKRVAQVIQQYETLDGVLKTGRFPSHAGCCASTGSWRQGMRNRGALAR
jgi:hypothetical protein